MVYLHVFRGDHCVFKKTKTKKENGKPPLCAVILSKRSMNMSKYVE